MSNVKSKAPRYGEAAAELETILQEIETGEVDIDDLTRKVERAAELIRLCRDKLRATEVRVKKIVDEMASDAPAPDADADDREQDGPEG
jgi:exodeoxyribonuclease VII small subunit